MDQFQAATLASDFAPASDHFADPRAIDETNIFHLQHDLQETITEKVFDLVVKQGNG
jgi:hypothetical protein